MPDGEDWLWRPLDNGMCKYESMMDGTLGLEDIAIMNDILSVRFENQARIRDAVDRDRQ